MTVYLGGGQRSQNIVDFLFGHSHGVIPACISHAIPFPSFRLLASRFMTSLLPCESLPKFCHAHLSSVCGLSMGQEGRREDMNELFQVWKSFLAPLPSSQEAFEVANVHCVLLKGVFVGFSVQRGNILPIIFYKF